MSSLTTALGSLSMPSVAVLGVGAVLALIVAAVSAADRTAQRAAWRRIAAARQELGEERRRLAALGAALRPRD